MARRCPKCPWFQHLQFKLVLTEIEAWTHTNTHTDAHDTQYLKRLSRAKLGGTIMTSCLLDLLSATPSNWMMIIIQVISSLEHFFNNFLFFPWLFAYINYTNIFLSVLFVSFSHTFSSLSSTLTFSLLPSFLEKGPQTFIALCILLGNATSKLILHITVMQNLHCGSNSIWYIAESCWKQIILNQGNSTVIRVCIIV